MSLPLPILSTIITRSVAPPEDLIVGNTAWKLSQDPASGRWTAACADLDLVVEAEYKEELLDLVNARCRLDES